MRILMSEGEKLSISGILTRPTSFIRQNALIVAFFITHTLFAIFLGRLFALAPDEGAYLYTFDHVYKWPINPWAQSSSGWITAPTIFLWIAYLPAKILNMLGLPDYLSIRILSIMLSTLSLYLLKNILDPVIPKLKIRYKVIFIVFFIPSIFLWTSVGLRESFIIAEITAFLVGLNFLMNGKNKPAYALLFIGSYGLISTKNYLWACLMVTVILSSIIFRLQGTPWRKILSLFVAGLCIPIIVFASTTSAYALEFMLHVNISSTGERSGDSISQVYVNASSGGSTPSGSTPSGSTTGHIATGSAASGSAKTLITFHGDYTLIALHFYLIDNPNAVFSKIFRVLHLDKKIQSIWDEKVALGLIHKDNQVGTDTSSLNGHILEPGKISHPLSMVWPAFVFLCGPFPFIGDPGIAVFISSLESPLWWAFYALIIFQFIRFRKVKFLRDPQMLFTLIFLAGEIVFSALVEVNLGTSFRHRSILLVPLVFLYVRLVERAKEQEDVIQGRP